MLYGNGGRGHFYGHQKAGSEIAGKILLRLKYDKNTIETVTELILYHNADIQPRRKNVKRWLNKIGEKRLRQLLEVKRADAMAHSADCSMKKLAELAQVLFFIDEIIDQKQCFSLKDLALKGDDLINSGMPEGVNIGIILNKLMEMVIDERIENDKMKLLETASILSTVIS